MATGSFSGGFDPGKFDSGGDDREGLSQDSRLRLISDLWSELNVSGETGATDRATLERIEREVTEAMYRDMPDFDQAESLTFMALHLISGNV